MTRPLAIVTGAGSGIGAAIATRLAARYDLLLTHRHSDADLDDVRAETRQLGATTTTVTGDLTHQTTMDELGSHITAAADRLETVVSNAGAYPRTPWNSMTLDHFRTQIDLNLTVHAALAAHTSPPLTARGHGRFITISSVLTQIGRVDLAAYIAAKAGLEGLTRALARELGPHGVTVNCIRAGSIAVPTEHTVVDDHAAMVGRQLARQCVKRRGRPEDIAAAVDFLASGDAGFITGQCLTVDGGWSFT